MNLDYVRFRCQVNHRLELSISCEIYKSYCFIFYRITSDVGQTAGNNNSNYMSICLLPLHVWNKIHLGISKKDHICWIPSIKWGFYEKGFTIYVLLTMHPSIIFFKWNQLGAHYVSVHLFQLLYMFWATMCPSSGELTVSMRLIPTSRSESHPHGVKNTIVT